MNKPRLIVGLGNPGAKYKSTKHNAGFMVVDAISASIGLPIKRGDKNCVWGEGDLNGDPIILLKPQLYMNRSGQALRAFLSMRNIEISDIMVVYDDMDIELGCIRVKTKGGSGGHNGIASIIDALGTKNFPRLRLGIGECKGDGASYVLSGFGKSERKVWEKTIDKAHDAVILSITEDISTVMNRFNSIL